MWHPAVIEVIPSWVASLTVQALVIRGRRWWKTTKFDFGSILYILITISHFSELNMCWHLATHLKNVEGSFSRLGTDVTPLSQIPPTTPLLKHGGRPSQPVRCA